MNYCTIDHNIRKIRVPISEKILGVVGDKDIKRRYFKAPRYYEGNDLSKFDIKINYVNEDCDKNMYVVDDVQTEDDYITFSWLIGAGACRVPGDVGYVVCMRLVDEGGNVVKEYNTELTIGTILDGCEADSTEDEEETKDIVAQFMRYLDDVKNEVKKSVSDGKSELAVAITEKGIETASDDSFITMAENVRQIESGTEGGTSFDRVIVSLDKYMINTSTIRCNVYLGEEG